MQERKQIVKNSQYQRQSSSRRVVRSPQYREGTTTVYRQSNLQPSVHIETQRSDVRSTSNPSISQTVSFGGAGSSLKKNNTVSITLKNKDTYEGELNSKNQFHGVGKYVIMKDQLEYVGDFRNGKQHGKGKLYKLYSGSSSYYGSKIHGKTLIYEGEWEYGKKNGYGKYYYDPESSQTHYYAGLWKDDHKHGKYDKKHGEYDPQSKYHHGNQYVYLTPQFYYQGDWKYGEMCGTGTFKNFKTGSIFHGTFEKNQFEKGSITYSNEDEYRGLVKQGYKEDNQGRYIFRKSNSSDHPHDCTCHMHGPETLYNKEYIGGWKRDMKNGKCIVNYSNGDFSRYMYENNMMPMTFECTYRWNNGSQFNGWLKKDQNNVYQYERGTYKQPGKSIVEV